MSGVEVVEDPGRREEGKLKRERVERRERKGRVPYFSLSVPQGCVYVLEERRRDKEGNDKERKGKM
jgi:hypothetical protein